MVKSCAHSLRKDEVEVSVQSDAVAQLLLSTNDRNYESEFYIRCKSRSSFFMRSSMALRSSARSMAG